MLGRVWVLGVLLIAGCPRSSGTQADGSEGPPPPDTPLSSEGGGRALAVDFAVVGCPAFDQEAMRCHGSPPLTVSFVPVVSEGIDRFLWSFGDGSPLDSLRSPAHTFALPGSYDVKLTAAAGADSAASPDHPGIVTVDPVPVGGACGTDRECGAGLRCLCSPGTIQCPPAFVRGICTAECGGDCGAGAVCADLARSADGVLNAGSDPWRRRFCLQACAGDADCRPGLRCRSLPGPSAPPWVKACFIPFPPGDVGGSCFNAAGNPDNSQCVTGVCKQDLGLLGLCTLDCAAASCPEGTACARFNNGTTVICLRGCSASSDCGSDPLLACEAPGASGDLGFSVATAPAGARFCAPRSCRDSSECGPRGTCPPTNGHCLSCPRTGTCP